MTVVPTKIAATESKQASSAAKKALKQPMLPRLPKVPEQEGRQNVLLTICMIKKKRVNRLSSYEALRNTNYQTIFYQAVLY